MANAFYKAAAKKAVKIKNPLTPTVDPSDETQDDYADNEAKKVKPVEVAIGKQSKPSDAGKKKSAKGIEHMKSKDKNVKRQFSDVELEVAARFGRDPVMAYADDEVPAKDDELAALEAELAALPAEEPAAEAPAEEPAATEEPAAEEPASSESEVASLVERLQALIDNKELELKAKEKKDLETAIDEMNRLVASVKAARDYLAEYEPKAEEAVAVEAEA